MHREELGVMGVDQEHVGFGGLDPAEDRLEIARVQIEWLVESISSAWWRAG
jgi:hypothetical protein